MKPVSQNQKALAMHLVLIVATMALLFVPAGTVHYWQAWTFLVCYFVPSLAITVYLMASDPQPLARRMRGGPTAARLPPISGLDGGGLHQLR